MQDPNEDTEWNDALRAKGIIPKKEITEEDVVNILENTIQEKTSTDQSFGSKTLDELNELEDDIDDEDEKAFEHYRRKRLQEMMALQKKCVYGEVRDISKSEWTTQVNDAGDGVWVVIHIYKTGIPLCTLLNQHLSQLGAKFRHVKFLRGLAELCIPDYPDKHVPTVFIYRDGQLKHQWVGPIQVGGPKVTRDDVEWKLAQAGVLETDLEEDPHQPIQDVLRSALAAGGDSGEGEEW